jgi:Na+-driven multidrug efflux pump
MLLPPILGRLVDSGDRTGAERIASDFLNFFLMIAIPFAIGALLAGPSIVALLADAQTAYASRWVTCLVVLGTSLYGISVLHYQAAYVLARMQLVMMANLIGAILNIALNALLLYIFRDLTVAALASLISYGATTLYIVFALRRDWHFRIDWGRIGKFIIATIPMAVLLMLLGLRPLAVNPMGVMPLIGLVAGAATIYFVILWMWGGLRLQTITQIAAARSLGS